MNLEIPRMIQVNPRLAEVTEENYPKLRNLFSTEFITHETVFIVDNDYVKPYVDRNTGILYLNSDYLAFTMEAMAEFFRTYEMGVELTIALQGLIKLLSGELNGKEIKH